MTSPLFMLATLREKESGKKRSLVLGQCCGSVPSTACMFDVLVGIHDNDKLRLATAKVNSVTTSSFFFPLPPFFYPTHTLPHAYFSGLFTFLSFSCRTIAAGLEN